MQTISYEQVGSVGWLRLNRPERLNAMTVEMWEELAKLGESLGDDASLRCLVVMGEGRAFSSGIDVEEALAIGLVNRLVEDADLESAATALAERIAGQPPIAVRGSKRAIDRACRQSLGEGLREAAVGQAECIRSADFVEAMKANMEKR